MSFCTCVLRFAPLIIAILISGCGLGRLGIDGREVADDIAEAAGLQRAELTDGTFLLRVYHRGLVQRTTPLHVYIEGDGRAWKSRRRLSRDPTPKEPMALRMAARDRAAAVMYIGRPCQYLNERQLQRCDKKYWSSHRYGEQVIAASKHVIDWAMSRARGADSRLLLVGYSGGGQVAAQVAARRPDNTRLVTVAGNIDHVAWTTFHRHTPLKGSLNASDYGDVLRDVPQWHFVGGEDEIVPASVVRSYLKQLGDARKARLVVVPDLPHHEGWDAAWPELLFSRPDWHVP